MAITKAEASYNWGGLNIKQLLTTWVNEPLNAVKYVVIHNTPEVTHSNTSMSAQYSLAQYNHNLGDVAVHYYVDGKEIWHCLPDTKHGWHAADGRNAAGGNMCGIAIEVIEDKTNEKAEKDAAKLSALLLYKYNLGIDALKQHHDFYNKNCPIVIRPHWEQFKTQVNNYLQELKTPPKAKDEEETIWRVQVGAFKNKAYAEDFVRTLKLAGFDAYITK